MPSERRKVFIAGGSGSGKSTLAREIGNRTGLPVHDLDQIARIGGGNGPERDAAERDALVDEILGSPAWVVEGIHLGWTERLLGAADTIIWLDHVAWAQSSRRIVTRFVSQAAGEARRRRGWRRYLRVRDYGRHLRELAAAISESRGYHHAPAGSRGNHSPITGRAAAAEELRRYGTKVIHCRTGADIDAALRSVTT